MPRAPVTTNIVPSRLAGGVHLCVALLICLSMSFYAPPWLLVAAVSLLAFVLWRHRERPWQLRWVPQAGRTGRWQYRDAAIEPWRDTDLGVSYLGPWLIALTVGDRRCWLWPDSASPEALYDLRRIILLSHASRDDAQSR
ncbi:hypothetical protein GCM10007160_38290 [Litchfieldella qijiaojingensis]|uniref:Toxin CptA n=1 Tax=Litchfieldella qijiaojingensis TaxID=980347 RepID=A0ABQ2ZAK2_9GAMM|nr:protein YgfX [Halomonas qijiaojingensis]GGY07134.1 hypothetical protein GCM10007160_38290 [Halomonas qijiaojingensis]